MLLVAFLLSPWIQESAPQRALHSLDRVTIYNGQALVERSFSWSAVEPGPVDLLLGPFPLEAQSDSFQAKVEDGPVRFMDLEVRSAVGQASGGTAREALAAELAALQEERRALDADLAAITAGERLVQAVVAAVSGGGARPSEVGMEITIGNLFEFVRARSRELDVEKAGYEKRVRELEGRIRDLQGQLGALERGELQRFQEVKVSLFFERAGEARLRLTYLARNAWWVPTYDVRVAPDLTGVTVGLLGEVRQRTGEDWDNAQILLSTAAPSIGLDPPKLPLRVVQLPEYRRAGERELDAPEELGYADARPSAAPAGKAADQDDKFVPAPEVQVQDYGITTQFLLPQRKSVRGSGEAHRFILREVPLQVAAERYVVPSLSDQAFLRAEVQLSGDAPLLAGQAKVFLGPDYLGQASFPTLRPGDKTMIQLGLDPNLTVSYETVIDERDEPGLLASTVRVTRVYRATLKLSAAAPGPVDVILEDAIPVSRNEEVEVTPTQLQPAPLGDDEAKRLQRERGVYRWRVPLAPGASANVRWGYVMAFDEDLEPWMHEE